MALVTGGSPGIGAAIAVELADQGADLAISYVTNTDKANTVVEAYSKGAARDLAAKGITSTSSQAALSPRI